MSHQSQNWQPTTIPSLQWKHGWQALQHQATTDSLKSTVTWLLITQTWTLSHTYSILFALTHWEVYALCFYSSRHQAVVHWLSFWFWSSIWFSHFPLSHCSLPDPCLYLDLPLDYVFALFAVFIKALNTCTCVHTCNVTSTFSYFPTSLLTFSRNHSKYYFDSKIYGRILKMY